MIGKNTVVALGTFDGMHVAHRKIVEMAVRMAGIRGYASLVYTFRNLPAGYFGGEKRFLFSEREKTDYLKGMGIDYLSMNTFGKEIAETEPEDFLRMLRDSFRAKAVICGYNFRFGRNGRGDADTIRRFADDNGMEVFVLGQTMAGDMTVSSTNIRELILQGDLEGAEELLGHHYYFTGSVLEGRRIGRTIGFPTINLSYDEGKLLPPSGVYASEVLLGGEHLIGVTNIGNRPTVGNGSDITIETNIIDYDDDLYGREVTLVLRKFIRKEKDFGSLEELKEEIGRNREQVRRFFEGAREE